MQQNLPFLFLFPRVPNSNPLGQRQQRITTVLPPRKKVVKATLWSSFWYVWSLLSWLSWWLLLFINSSSKRMRLLNRVLDRLSSTLVADEGILQLSSCLVSWTICWTWPSIIVDPSSIKAFSHSRHSMDAPRLPPPRQSTNNAANRAPTPPRDITPPPPGPSSSIYSSNILITTSPHPNTREAQLQIHQAASHPIFPEDGKPLEPPPPYSMGSAAYNTLHTPSLNANSPPSYSQSFADYFEFDI